MAITRWHPDTCGCILEYENAEVGQSVVRCCALHAGAGDPAAVHAAVLAHNRFKNAVQGHVHESSGRLGIQSPHDVGFAYAPGGAVLQVLGPIEPAAKATLRTELAAKFGAGKVEVI